MYTDVSPHLKPADLFICLDVGKYRNAQEIHVETFLSDYLQP